jgi:molecular chaperone GrpE
VNRRDGQELERDDLGRGDVADGGEGHDDGETGAGAPDAPSAAADETGLEAGETGADPSERLSDEIRAELAELEALRERHLRLAAEYDNYRKRTRRELAEASERAQGGLIARLLDGLDDLERVLATPAEATTVEALHEGVELVERKLRKELSEAGLERIEAEGEPFDPRLHDALLTVPVADPTLDEVVSRVLVNGYRLGDRVLRPARVEVMKYQPGVGNAAGDGAGDGAA